MVSPEVNLTAENAEHAEKMHFNSELFSAISAASAMK
jgi:hypothetical protein